MTTEPSRFGDGTFHMLTSGPAQASPIYIVHTHPIANAVCLACEKRFEVGDWYVTVPLGPGDDGDERRLCAHGRTYSAIAVPIHARCAGIEEGP